MTLDKRKKSLIITVIAAVTVLTVIIVAVAVNSVYVFIGGEAIRKDSAEVQVGLFNDRKIGRDLKRLDKFSEMDILYLTSVSDKNTRYVSKVKSLKNLGFGISEINDMTFLGNFENIETLHFFQSKIDFEMLPEDASIRSLELWSCNAKNFCKVGQCKAIKKLDIFQCDLNGEGEGYTSNELDSKIFSGFDHVESVEISNMRIPDISGFLEMKSLKSLTIKRYLLDELPITDEQADELHKAGIDLTLDNEKIS